MPLVSILIEFSNGAKENIYYPSTAVLNYIKKNEYTLNEFLELANKSLEEAQRRVKEKYGFECIGCYFLKDKFRRWSENLNADIIVSIKKIKKW